MKRPDIVQAHFRPLKLKNAADAGLQCRIWSKNRLETPKVLSPRIAPLYTIPHVRENAKNSYGEEKRQVGAGNRSKLARSKRKRQIRARKQPKPARGKENNSSVRESVRFPHGQENRQFARDNGQTCAGGSEKASVGANVRKGGDRDPGRERERLPEHGTAGVQGRPGGKRVVNQEDMGCRA